MSDVPILTASRVAEIAEKCGTRDGDFYVMSPFQLFAFAQRCVNHATGQTVCITAERLAALERDAAGYHAMCRAFAAMKEQT